MRNERLTSPEPTSRRRSKTGGVMAGIAAVLIAGGAAFAGGSGDGGEKCSVTVTNPDGTPKLDPITGDPIISHDCPTTTHTEYPTTTIIVTTTEGTTTTVAPTTSEAPTTSGVATTVTSSTVAPTTVAPTTVAPTTVAPTTVAPSTLPTQESTPPFSL